MRSKKALIGVAGVHLVVAELSRRGVIALPTTRNTEGIDVLASNTNTGKAVSIQVKTCQYMKKNRPYWILGKGSEELKKADLYYVFVYLPQGDAPRFYIVPSKTVADYVTETHRKWLRTPGRGGRQHKDSPMRQFPNEFKTFDLEKCRDKWELLKLW